MIRSGVCRCFLYHKAQVEFHKNCPNQNFSITNIFKCFASFYLVNFFLSSLFMFCFIKKNCVADGSSYFPEQFFKKRERLSKVFLQRGSSHSFWKLNQWSSFLRSCHLFLSQVLLASLGMVVQENHQYFCNLTLTQALKWNKFELEMPVLLEVLQNLQSNVDC